MQGIESQESEALLGAHNEIELENARAMVQSISQALQALQIAAGRELGLGNLELGQADLALRQMLAEWQQAIWQMENSAGVPDENSDVVQQLIDAIRGGNDGRIPTFA